VPDLERTGVVALPVLPGCNMEAGPRVDSAGQVLLPRGVEQMERKTEVGWMARSRRGSDLAFLQPRQGSCIPNSGSSTRHHFSFSQHWVLQGFLPLCSPVSFPHPGWMLKKGREGG